MSLPYSARVDATRTNAPASRVETPEESWATSVRQVVESQPAAMRAMGITPDRLNRIRFNKATGEVDIPIGRRNDAAAAIILHEMHNTTDIGEGAGAYEFRGIRFRPER